MNAIPSHLLIPKFDMRSELGLKGMEDTAVYHLDLAANEQRQIDALYREIDAEMDAARAKAKAKHAVIDEKMKRIRRLKLIAQDWAEHRDYASQWAMPQAQ